MADHGSLLILLTEALQPESRNIPQLRPLVDTYQSEDVRTLFNRLRSGSEPEDAFCLLATNFILRAEDSQEIIGFEITSKAVESFLRLCDSKNLQPSQYLNHITSLMIRELLSTDNIEEVFSYGKLALKLRNERLDISTIEYALDIAYSPLIFDLAMGTEKDKIQEALKALIKAKELKLDSTGAQHAIIENSLSWVEDNEDFYNIRSSSGQRVEPDRESTQIILGLLQNLELNGQEFIDRLNILKERYGSIDVINIYAPEVNDPDIPARDVQPLQGEIQSKSLIEITEEAFKLTHTDDRSVETRLYKAKIKANNKEICVKKITVKDRNNLNRFYQEVNTLRLLSGKHECFLNYYGSFIEDNNLYILMEYIQSTLMEVITRGKLTELQQIDIMKKLLQGFSFLSQNRIYHRDIKPHNIMLTDNHIPKIIDFGISVFELNPSLSSVTQIATNSRFVQGTQGYMSPEQKLAYNHYSRTKSTMKYGLLKSDVFSLGITFFQMVTGKEVSKFEEEKYNDELLAEVARLPSTIKTIITDMVNKDPEKRKTFIELASKSQGTIYTFIN